MLIQANTKQFKLPITLTNLPNSKLKVEFQYNQELVDEIKSYQGAKWHPAPERYWTIDNSERNLYCLRMLSGKLDPVYFNSHPTETTYKEFRKELMTHQRELASEAIAKQKVVWAAEPGTGKTLAAIQVMELMPSDWQWWVIIPRTAYAVWEYEFDKWKVNQSLRNRIKIINHHLLFDLMAKVKEIPNGIVIDEVHFFKNPESKRATALLALAALVRDKSGVVIPMTGTPAPHDPTDWWLLCELCQPGFLREASKAKLKYRLGVHEDMGAYFKLIKWRQDEVEKLYRRMKGMVCIKLAKDCLDLPPLIETQHRFTVDSYTRSIASLIKENSPRAITALIRLRQYSDGFQPTKVCSLCRGSGVYIPDPAFGQPENCPACEGSGFLGGESVETPKDEALIEYLSEDRNRIVIYAGFHLSIDKIVKLCHQCGWQVIQVDGRGASIDSPLPNNPQMAFTQGRCPTCEQIGYYDNCRKCGKKMTVEGKIAYVGHPTAGGVSITLAKSEIIIFYSNDFNGASRMQAIKRIHRIGTTKATIIDFIWLPSDQLVLDNLTAKRDLQAITLGELNNYWERTNK